MASPGSPLAPHAPQFPLPSKLCFDASPRPQTGCLLEYGLSMRPEPSQKLEKRRRGLLVRRTCRHKETAGGQSNDLFAGEDILLSQTGSAASHGPESQEEDGDVEGGSTDGWGQEQDTELWKCLEALRVKGSL